MKQTKNGCEVCAAGKWPVLKPEHLMRVCDKHFEESTALKTVSFREAGYAEKLAEKEMWERQMQAKKIRLMQAAMVCGVVGFGVIVYLLAIIAFK